MIASISLIDKNNYSQHLSKRYNLTKFDLVELKQWDHSGNDRPNGTQPISEGTRPSRPCWQRLGEAMRDSSRIGFRPNRTQPITNEFLWIDFSDFKDKCQDKLLLFIVLRKLMLIQYIHTCLDEFCWLLYWSLIFKYLFLDRIDLTLWADSWPISPGAELRISSIESLNYEYNFKIDGLSFVEF